MKQLTIALLTLPIFMGVWAEPMTFLEVEEEGYLIVSEKSNEILMVDHSNQKWLRAIIYSQNPIEVKYNRGSCIKSFADWDTLKDLNGKVNSAQTYFTSHIISMDSEDLRSDIEQYKRNNEDFQVSLRILLLNNFEFYFSMRDNLLSMSLLK